MPGYYSNEAERLTGKLLEGLRYDKIDEIFDRGLHAYLTELLESCLAIGQNIAQHLLLLRGDGMNRYHLVHITEFRYDGPVSESYNEVRLRPLTDDSRAACRSG